MSARSINENSTAWLKVAFLDQYGAAVVPDSLTYRIDCETTAAAIRVETAATPGQDIVLTPDDNHIVDNSDERETRVVTVHAVRGTDEFRDVYRYDVVNLRFFRT